MSQSWLFGGGGSCRWWYLRSSGGCVAGEWRCLAMSEVGSVRFLVTVIFLLERRRFRITGVGRCSVGEPFRERCCLGTPWVRRGGKLRERKWREREREMKKHRLF
ncbi:hypothetical protein Hanom_Chr06g00523731 [Helianthus anomalus]